MDDSLARRIDRALDALSDAERELQDALQDTTAEIAMGWLDRLHEAICEDRKQDAIDILNEEFPNANLRSVKTQSRLFPNRVSE